MKNISDIQILKAVEKDMEDIQRVTIESSRGMYEICGWSEDDIKKYFSIKKPAPQFPRNDILFVAQNKEREIVGYCLARREQDMNNIEALYLLKEYQGITLAQKLYHEVLPLLDPQKNTFLNVFSLNSKALNFYKKMGFIETGKKFFDEKFTNPTSGIMLEISEMKLG